MLINIDKLLALLLLTFSPSKVGLRAASAMTKPWFSVCLFNSQHPDQLTTWLGRTVRREKGVKTSVGWLWVTHGTSHNGRRDTVLCIMDRVPGISGIPRHGGGWGETDRDLPSRVMHWMSIPANQRPCNTVDQPLRDLNFFMRYNNQSQRSLGLRQLSISQCFIKCIQISEPWGKRRLVRLWESIFGPFEMSKGKRSKRINSWLGYVSWSFLALVPRLVWWEPI